MDPSLLQLERELRSLSPVKPDLDLADRVSDRVIGVAAPVFTPVGRSIPAVRHTPFAWRRVAVPAAAAAAVVAAISQGGQRSGSLIGDTIASENRSAPGYAPSRPELVPAGSLREVRTIQDHGFFYDAGMEPTHGFTLEAVDHHTYLNPVDNSSIRLSIPREERTLVPVSFH